MADQKASSEEIKARLMDDIESISEEIHSLIHQNVKTLIDQRLEERGLLLEQLFNLDISPNEHDRERLERILSGDLKSKGMLEQQQKDYNQRNQKQSKLRIYKQSFDL